METHTNKAALCAPSSEIYKYSRVDSELNEIRVAKILPGNRTEPLICQLSNVFLTDNPSYEALSYTWGNEEACRSISINGKNASITKNLESALRRLRSADKIVTIWVDSICINQEDLTERGAQTSRMRSIYRQADLVRVWLGDSGEEGDLAWTLLQDLDNASEAIINDIIGDYSRFEQFQALKKLFRRRYWFRVWVVQEVTLGRDVSVYWGEHSISWNRLYAICENLKHLKEYLIRSFYPNDPTSVFSLLTGGPKSLTLTKRSFPTPPETQPSLLDLLYTHMSKHSTDPRDKIYALIGISNSLDTFGPIDYKRSIIDTFTYTARYIISTTGNLDIICICQNEDVKYDLPSWVPDWERRNEYPLHRVMGLHIRYPQFQASGKNYTAIVSFSENSRILRARGFTVDTIQEVSSKFWINGNHGNNVKVIQTLHTFKEWLALYLRFKGAEASLEEFNNTFCGGSWAAVYDVHHKKRIQLFCSLFKILLPGVEFSSAPSFSAATVESVEDQRATVSAASLRMHNKRLALSKVEKLACLAPADAREGDLICILLGCDYPVLLRQVDGHHILVGEVYVDGKMHGEAMHLKPEAIDFEIH